MASESDNETPILSVNEPPLRIYHHDEDYEELFCNIKANDPGANLLDLVFPQAVRIIASITNTNKWEQLGRDISNNSHLERLTIGQCALNDDEASALFQGLTRSSSIKYLMLSENDIGVAGAWSMLPLLHHVPNLVKLDLDNNPIQSEGFNLVLRALSGSPIKWLSCDGCSIESIDSDMDIFRTKLVYLDLQHNKIGRDGCSEIAKLLRGGDSTLTQLHLSHNKIDDECVAILVNALQNNTSLRILRLCEHFLDPNPKISREGKIMLLKLVNDISSSKATLESNHTLTQIVLEMPCGLFSLDREVLDHIEMATKINRDNQNGPETAFREKVIQTQLHSARRAELADLEGVQRSWCSAINDIHPLHLPEVLALIGRRHGPKELYAALSATITTLLSTVDRQKSMKKRLEYHSLMIAQHGARLEELRRTMTVEASEGNRLTEHIIERRSIKRCRRL